MKIKDMVVVSLLQMISSQNLFAQEIPLPTAQQVAWQQAEPGVVFRYDLHVFDSSRYIQRVNRITPVPDCNIFNPSAFNIDQWVRKA